MVQWVDGAIADPAPASDAAVREAEDASRVDLPADFLAIARTHQGTAPEPSRVTLPDGSETAVAYLLHFEAAPGHANLVAARFPVAGVLEKGIIPFARDIAGDLFCFNYRENYDAPSVVYWSVDTGAVRLADNFTAFLNLLHG